jgi:regulator of cell morphogenesis and NO signaling
MATMFETWTGEPDELTRCQEASLADLVRYIVDQYHREARVEMARLETLAEEAVLMEGEGFPELRVVRDEVERFCTELRGHFRREERSVFPAVLELDRDPDGTVPPALRDPLLLVTEEHQTAAGLLERIRQLTAGFNPSQGARALQRKLYLTFQQLADSLERHIYLENQVLFKRVLHRQ